MIFLWFVDDFLVLGVLLIKMCFWLQREACFHYFSVSLRLASLCCTRVLILCLDMVFFEKCASGCSGKHIFVRGHSDFSLSVPWLFQSSRRSGWERVSSELGGTVSCQSWVGTRRVRSCAFVISLFSEVSAFGKCASGCSGKHVFSLSFNDCWRIFNDFFMIV